MTLKEYNAMHEAKGTPKVWKVDYAFCCPGVVETKLFKTEDEARRFADTCPHLVCIDRTWDIWNWSKKH